MIVTLQLTTAEGEGIFAFIRKVENFMSTAAQALIDIQNAETLTDQQVAALTTAITTLQAGLTAGIAALEKLIATGGVSPSAVEAIVADMKTQQSNVATGLSNIAAMGTQIAQATQISVSVSPATAGPLAQGATQKFTATVTNDPASAGVTWSVTAPAKGSVDQTGLYTPPTTPGGSDTVVATSVTDPSKSGSATVTF